MPIIAKAERALIEISFLNSLFQVDWYKNTPKAKKSQSKENNEMRMHELCMFVYFSCTRYLVVSFYFSVSHKRCEIQANCSILFFRFLLSKNDFFDFFWVGLFIFFSLFYFRFSFLFCVYLLFVFYLWLNGFCNYVNMFMLVKHFILFHSSARPLSLSCPRSFSFI